MMFHSAQYLALVLLSWALFWLVSGPLARAEQSKRRLARRKWLRLLVLGAASFTFYAAWSLWPIVLFSAYALVNFLAGQALERTQRPAARRAIMITAVSLHLTGLFTFKYLDFALRAYGSLAQWLHLGAAPKPVGLVLPVGLSFVAFQAISYVVDVYRKQTSGRYSYPQHWVFKHFFPQVVAGPIIRSRDLMEHLAEEPKVTPQESLVGVFRIAQGIAKKLALADVLAAALVDPVFANPKGYSALECLVAAVAYTFQIYFDFSAYSDIAIGTAALFGFKFPENFDKPYHARNLFEFWNRWHVSLSTWLRDYLYRPMGGSRRGKARTLFNLMVVMTLGGLWHGADWRFLVWGTLHGVFLVVLRVWWWVRGKPTYERWWQVAWGTAVAFTVVVLTRVFFRAESVTAALGYFRQMGTLTFDLARVSWLAWGSLAAAVVLYVMPKPVFELAKVTFVRIPAPVRALALIAFGLLLRRIASFETQPYIYFQF